MDRNFREKVPLNSGNFEAIASLHADLLVAVSKLKQGEVKKGAYGSDSNIETTQLWNVVKNLRYPFTSKLYYAALSKAFEKIGLKVGERSFDIKAVNIDITSDRDRGGIVYLWLWGYNLKAHLKKLTSDILRESAGEELMAYCKRQDTSTATPARR